MTGPVVRPAAAAATAAALFGGLVATVLVTAPGVLGVDTQVAARLHRPALVHPWFGDLLRVVALVTEPFWLRVAAAVVAGALWHRGRHRAAGWLVATMTVGGGLGIGLKQVFTRSRPEWPQAVTVASGYSFPSGHALNSGLAAICLFVLLRPALRRAGRVRLGVACTAYVLAVGLDRMLLGVHYLTDVLAGWTLAAAVSLGLLSAFGGAARTAGEGPDPPSPD